VTHGRRTILQLDFDGTLVKGDASTGILQRFAGAEWLERINAASRALLIDPNSTALIDTMTAGYAVLGTDFDAYVDYVHNYHPARPGLRHLLDTAEPLGIEAHVVSNGFEFYIRDHLRAAGVEDRVALHTGAADGTALSYAAPDGTPLRNRFKDCWTEHLSRDGATVIYVGDGTSDITAASLCAIVFARDGLLTGLQGRFQGELRPFETLHDVARGLREVTRG
jgi:2-hydroxy-3-keto-5-methylthiopentenyl-1-phosphate phosphatase